jgi:CRP-like cAMP-binding protein
MTDSCPGCGPDFVHWLKADPARETAWLALPRRWVDVGQVLQSVGRSLSGVWFVEQGLLRSYFLNPDGLERNCAFHAEWEWAGMLPPRGAPVVAEVAIDALERSQVVELSHAGLAAWLQRQPELQAALTETLLVALMGSSRRESALMMGSAEQRYMQFLAEHPATFERVALHHVASYLGITNVALSRIRRRIKDRRASLASTGQATARAG